MQLLYDFLPIILFFIAYKFAGIYVATAIAMGISLLQILFIGLKKHKLPKMQLITLVLILTLGSATLFFHKPIFIKWKPTIVYWLFGLVFLGSHFVGSKKPLMAYMLQEKVSLSETILKKMNYSWGLFFLAIGTLNLFVVYHYNTNVWVDFKLFGVLSITVLFMLAQAFYLMKFVKSQ